MKNLTYHQIEDAAEAFRKKHDPDLSLPVPVEYIVEFDLELEIITHKGLFSAESIDAFLSADMKELHIDEDHYMGQTNRSRFTLAHEVGHYVLHPQLVKAAKSRDDWKKMIMGAGTGRGLYESQANDFAGCLLMPRADVLKELEKQKKVTEKQFKDAGLPVPEEAILITYISNAIARKFDVSEQAAEIRLEKILKYPR